MHDGEINKYNFTVRIRVDYRLECEVRFIYNNGEKLNFSFVKEGFYNILKLQL